jgi:hypothetical protein
LVPRHVDDQRAACTSAPDAAACASRAPSSSVRAIERPNGLAWSAAVNEPSTECPPGEPMAMRRTVRCGRASTGASTPSSRRARDARGTEVLAAHFLLRDHGALEHADAHAAARQLERDDGAGRSAAHHDDVEALVGESHDARW